MTLHQNVLGRGVKVEDTHYLHLDLYEYASLRGTIVAAFLQQRSDPDGYWTPVFGIEIELTGDLIWLTSAQFTLNEPVRTENT